ncbi:hypothetical protein F4Y93_00685 [Candidatus Poribacteria bacterium]|nr:hypothetical protein [Candidatus Poribacteria bacterium]
MPKFSTILQVFLSLVGIYLAALGIYYTIKLRPIINIDLPKLKNSISELRDTTLAVSKKQDEIKRLLVEQADTLKNMQDNLLVRMDSLDACIDSHFVNTRARLIRMERKLE